MEMVRAIDEAEQRLEGIASTTPLQPSIRLSEQYGARILIKREDMQAVRSFKIRGAYNKIASLSPEDRKRPIVCASAGNHAQGVAFACAHLGIGGTIFMPRITPTQKIERVEHFGGEFFGIVSRCVLGFSEGVMFAQVAIRVAVRGNSHAYARGEQAVRFVGGVLRYHREDDFPVVQVRQTLGPWNEFTVGRKNGRDANQVLRRNARVSERQLERCETFLVFADPLGKKNPLGDHVFAQFVILRPGCARRDNLT